MKTKKKPKKNLKTATLCLIKNIAVPKKDKIDKFCFVSCNGIYVLLVGALPKIYFFIILMNQFNGNLYPVTM